MTKRIIPTDLKTLQGIAEAATKCGQQFTAKLNQLNAKVKARGEANSSQLAQLDPSMRKASQAHYENDLGEFTKSLRRETDADRFENLRDLQGLLESCSFAKEHLGDPRKLASAHGLGEEKRSRIEASLATAGSATLRTLAAKAEVTVDKDLAAALVSVNDFIPVKERQFSSQLLAEKVWGEEAKAVNDLVSGIDKTLATALELNRSFEGKKAPGFSKIASGLKHGSEALVPAPAPTPRRTSINKISEGLATFEV